MPATQLRRPPSPPRKGFNHGLLGSSQQRSRGPLGRDAGREAGDSREDRVDSVRHRVFWAHPLGVDIDRDGDGGVACLPGGTPLTSCSDRCSLGTSASTSCHSQPRSRHRQPGLRSGGSSRSSKGLDPSQASREDCGAGPRSPRLSLSGENDAENDAEDDDDQGAPESGRLRPGTCLNFVMLDRRQTRMVSESTRSLFPELVGKNLTVRFKRR